MDPVDFPFWKEDSAYQHLTLSVNGDEATICLHVKPNAGLSSDTPLKLNSYDLSVDIELMLVLNRLRFEHPEVSVVTIKSGHPQVFSSGANIYMLKKSSHAFKVNFCKFTNETRLYLEEASTHSNKKFLCALNGTAAGGGYELALACDRIVLIDDKMANVSLPEVPLLGVLPGTGGLTRLTDKRMIRRDVADVFCTVSEGIKGQRAKDYGLVDEIYAKSKWDLGLEKEVNQLKRPVPKGPGIKLSQIAPTKSKSGFSYTYVDVELTNERVAKIVVKGPKAFEPNQISAMLERGSDLWLIQAFRELDDAILRLRFFYRDYGLWEFHTRGSISQVLHAEAPLYDAMAENAHWFLREILLQIGRAFKRIDVSSRSTVAIIDQESCYAGALFELLFACDRGYALETKNKTQSLALSPLNNGLLPTWNNFSRLALRFLKDQETHTQVKARCDAKNITVTDAHKLGLITFLLDEIDFFDELRLFKEERVSLSPDALSAMEANLRFPGPETMATKIFGRLSSWQNWVFIRENATGEHGALMSYGEDKRAAFDWERC